MITPGVKFMFISTFFFAAMNLLVKVIPNIPAIEIVFFRSLVSLVLSFIILKRKQGEYLGQQQTCVTTSGGGGCCGPDTLFSNSSANSSCQCGHHTVSIANFYHHSWNFYCEGKSKALAMVIFCHGICWCLACIRI